MVFSRGAEHPRDDAGAGDHSSARPIPALSLPAGMGCSPAVLELTNKPKGQINAVLLSHLPNWFLPI